METIKNEIEGYLEYCDKVRGMSLVTVAQKRSVLERFVRVTGVRSLAEVDNVTFERWMASENRRGVSAQSLNMYNSIIVAMVRYLRGVGREVPLNLSLIVKLKERSAKRRFYTAAEIERVVRVCDEGVRAYDGVAEGVCGEIANGICDEAVGLMIRIMFETGMRIAELRRLEVANFDGRCVRFVGKGRKPREAYVTEETWRRLRRYIERYEIDKYLWCVNKGEKTLNSEPLTVNTIRERLGAVFRAAGFEGFYPHALRHSFATDLQMRGASVAEIKEMIGHSSLATTERYLHGFDGRMRELFDKYR